MSSRAFSSATTRGELSLKGAVVVVGGRNALSRNSRCRHGEAGVSCKFAGKRLNLRGPCPKRNRSNAVSPSPRIRSLSFSGASVDNSEEDQGTSSSSSSSSSGIENSLQHGQYKIPKHIAVIMDGNYRWAVERGKRGEEGHEAGIAALRKLIESSKAWGVQAVTVYAFSVGNWKRGKGERNFIFNLFEMCLQTEIANLLENDVRIQFIGNRSSLSTSLQHLMTKAEFMTKSKSGLYLTVAINYSAREDIVAATQIIAKEVAAKEIEVSDINQELIQERLSTNIIPESYRQPDLLLRTSGEERLSDFLLWELAYTELFFTTVKWPDFDEQAFKEVIEMYSSRERRYGGREENV